MLAAHSAAMFRALLKELTPKEEAAPEEDDEEGAEEEPEQDSNKRKAESAPAEESVPKEAKKAAAPVKPEEIDAEPDSRPALKQKVSFEAVDTTLNVVPTLGNSLLMSLSDGGMQYLLAGARANVAITGGRYMYEVRLVEMLSPDDAGTNDSRKPKPRQLLRVGFSASGSSLVVPQDTDDAIFVDMDGGLMFGKRRTENDGHASLDS